MGDVRFLIVHHTASPNAYAPGDVPSLLRGFHSFHTGPDKGWPDVAYNFHVVLLGKCCGDVTQVAQEAPKYVSSNSSRERGGGALSFIA